MICFTERYGYEIYFPKSLENNLCKLWRRNDDEWEDLTNNLRKQFPDMDMLCSDTIKFWTRISDKDLARYYDKEVKAAIYNWFKSRGIKFSNKKENN